MIRHLVAAGLFGFFLGANLAEARPGGGGHGGGSGHGAAPSFRPSSGSPPFRPSGVSPSFYPSVSPSHRSYGTGLPPIVIYGSIGRPSPIIGGSPYFPSNSSYFPSTLSYSGRMPYRPYPYPYGGVVASVGYATYGPQSSYRSASLGGVIDPPEDLLPRKQIGMKVLQVADGSIAKEADLRVGDIILGVGNTPVKNFEELRDALAASKGEVDIVFVNGETGKLERLPITPVNGKIGIAVAPIELK